MWHVKPIYSILHQAKIIGKTMRVQCILSQHDLSQNIKHIHYCLQSQWQMCDSILITNLSSKEAKKSRRPEHMQKHAFYPTALTCTVQFQVLKSPGRPFVWQKAWIMVLWPLKVSVELLWWAIFRTLRQDGCSTVLAMGSESNSNS